MIHKFNHVSFYFVPTLHINTAVAFNVNILQSMKLNYDNTTCLTKNSFSEENHMMATIFQFKIYNIQMGRNQNKHNYMIRQTIFAFSTISSIPLIFKAIHKAPL